MKRLALLCLVALAVGGVLAGAVRGSSPRSKLRGFVCKHAVFPSNRAVSVTAVMRPVSQTQRMALKFELIGRNKRMHRLFHVKGGDLGAWIKPGDKNLGARPGDVWIFKHPVKDLAAPVTYRFHVHFRWSDGHGRTIGRVLRISRPCYQPELRPDLEVASIQVKAVSGQPGNDRYIAVIRNAGASAAGTFQVEFKDHSTMQTRTVQRLAAHDSIKETFVGPACTSGSAPTVTADPARQVPDFNRSNNSLTASCS
jgi:CARDB